LLQCHRGRTCGPLRFACPKPRFDRFVKVTFTHQPLCEVTITSLRGCCISAATKQPARFAELSSAGIPHEFSSIVISTQLQGDSSRLFPGATFSVEIQGPPKFARLSLNLSCADIVFP
jgi:hypothetical protein